MHPLLCVIKLPIIELGIGILSKLTGHVFNLILGYVGVGNCTLHLLILNISDFVYLLHNQTACMQHVSYRPIYGAVPRAYKET